MKKIPKKNFARVWIRILDQWSHGVFISGYFYRNGGVICTPHEWRYRIQSCTNQSQKNQNMSRATNGQTESVTSANVIPLTLHPEYAPVVRPISTMFVQ